MKFDTLVVFDLLNSNLPGAKSNFQWGRRIGQFKMSATKKYFTLLGKKSYSYKSKHFARVLDLRDSKSDICLTVTLTLAKINHKIIMNFT